ncbi:MAG: hypothetical protein ACLUEU_10840 [Oscillospiraceae bacterium]
MSARAQEGSTLCTAHDDGGVITAYGYGYYWRAARRNRSWRRAAASSWTAVIRRRPGRRRRRWERRCRVYCSPPTRPARPGLRLRAETNSRNDSLYTLQANGTWTLNKTYTYGLPVFADAFGYAGDAEPGTDQERYQVRSVQQLRFISLGLGPIEYRKPTGPKLHVTYETGTDREVTAATYQQFYLQYATITGVSVQSQSAAERDRPRRRSWKQSHDLIPNGTDREFPRSARKTLVPAHRRCGF